MSELCLQTPCVLCAVWLALETCAFRLHLSCSSFSVFCLCHVPSSSSHRAAVSAFAPSSASGTNILVSVNILTVFLSQGFSLVVWTVLLCGPNPAKCTASKETLSALVSHQLLQVLVSHWGQAQHDLYQLLKMKCLWCSAALSTSFACAVVWSTPDAGWLGWFWMCGLPELLPDLLVLPLCLSLPSWPFKLSQPVFFPVFVSPFLCHVLPCRLSVPALHAKQPWYNISFQIAWSYLGKSFDQRDVKFLVRDDLMDLYHFRYQFLSGKLPMPLQFSQNVLFELWFQLLWL